MNELKVLFSQAKNRLATIAKAQVTTIDRAKLTCTVQPYDGSAEVTEVQFRAKLGANDGFIIIPKLNSDVLIGFINGDSADAFIIETSEIEEIYIEVGGMKLVIKDGKLYMNTDSLTSEQAVKGTTLKAQLQTMEQRIDALFTAIQSSAVVPSDGGAAFKTNMIAVLATAPPAPQFDILSDKIFLQ